jgi:hypothetical protein
MNTADRNVTASKQLDLVLSFFVRVDGRLSVLLGVNVGMLGVLAVNAPPVREWRGHHFLLAIPVLLIGASLFQVHHAYFPQLEGGNGSLIYFREIAKRTETQYAEQFRAASDDAFLKDLLSQIWRNSQILNKKFERLRVAFDLVAWALVPWLVALVMLAAEQTASAHLLQK